MLLCTFTDTRRRLNNYFEFIRKCARAESGTRTRDLLITNVISDYPLMYWFLISYKDFLKFKRYFFGIQLLFI